MEAIYMSPKEAAERYGISRWMVYEILDLPESPDTLKVGSRRLLPIAAYDKFMAQMFAPEKRAEA